MLGALVVGGASAVALSRLEAGAHRLDTLQQLSTQLQQVRFFNADIGRWQTAYAWDARRSGPQKAVADTSANRAGYLKATQQLRETLAAMPQRSMTAGERSALARISVLWNEFFSTDDAIKDLYSLGDPLSVDRAEAMIGGPERATYYHINDETDALAESVRKRSAAEVEAASQAAWTAQLLVAAAVLLSVAGVALLASRVSNGIVRRVRRVHEALEAMARGDLTARARVGGDDEVARMAAALGRAQEQVRGVVASVA
ncbi:HAMP domain-containing protein, partial [Angustibacter sp. Root456]|uniref:HAMP domain-containing protein n=1 Tax=Angustibacter sp. Root456 TaxID=1736539 RepID=UPI00138F18C6